LELVAVIGRWRARFTSGGAIGYESLTGFDGVLGGGLGRVVEGAGWGDDVALGELGLPWVVCVVGAGSAGGDAGTAAVLFGGAVVPGAEDADDAFVVAEVSASPAGADVVAAAELSVVGT
jgi:hypothetical protein